MADLEILANNRLISDYEATPGVPAIDMQADSTADFKDCPLLVDSWLCEQFRPVP